MSTMAWDLYGKQVGGMAYFLSPVTLSDTSQSWASVISGMQKEVDRGTAGVG